MLWKSHKDAKFTEGSVWCSSLQCASEIVKHFFYIYKATSRISKHFRDIKARPEGGGQRAEGGGQVAGGGL